MIDHQPNPYDPEPDRARKHPKKHSVGDRAGNHLARIDEAGSWTKRREDCLKPDETIHIQITEKRSSYRETLFLVGCALFGVGIGYGLEWLYLLIAGIIAEFSHSLK
jgi:hypothetical protein